MPNILPPASSTLAATLTANNATPPATPVPVTITAVETTLENLTRMIQTNATVASEPAANSVTLTTALGDLTIAFAQQLSGSEKANLTQQLVDLLQSQKPLTLVIQPGSPPTQGAILLQQTTATAATTPPAPNISALPLPLLPPAPLQTGDVLPAVVLPSLPSVSTGLPTTLPQSIPPPTLPLTGTEQPVSTQPISGNAATPSPAASQIPVLQNQTSSQTVPAQQPNAFVLLQTTPQETQPNPAAYAQAPQALPSEIPVPSPPTNAMQAAPSAQIAALLPPGAEVSLHIDNIVPPAPLNAAQSPLPPLAPNQIQATVTGTGTNGGLILKVGDTSLFIKIPVTAPVGTSVIVTVTSAQETELVPLPTLDTSKFQSLPQTLNALAQASSQMAQQVLNNYIPQPTPALPGALLFLFSAFKSGNAREWISHPAADILTATGKIELLKSLSDDLNNAGQTTQDPIVGEWRSYPIPLFVQQQFQALTLHVHSDRDSRQQHSGGGSPNKIRFLIDMRLSKLGDMQIDGFVQPKKLDMILRSENFLPEGLHNELRDSYQKALGAVGYGGTLHFQVGRQYWMRMQNQKARGIVT